MYLKMDVYICCSVKNLVTFDDVAFVGVTVCAVVYDAVHIKIQAVELWCCLTVVHLIDARVPLAEPTVELWDTHVELGV